ncbi:MAG: hypothetical protein IJR95_00495 [Lachnospiraceae bacterium]|nr:hypothetical protein [Lachnospiraceae bacterium]
MSGTEKILQHIAEQAGQEVQEILNKAQTEAKRLEAQAQAARQEEMDEVRQQGERLLEAARERAQVAAVTYKRRTLLAARGGLVKEALDKAWESILAMPDTEYFDFLYTQLDKQNLAREGVLLLNAKDLARRPADFEKKIGAAAEKQKGKLSLSEKAAEIEGGFILSYGGIEENCSLEALFESEADVLKDAVRAVLFEA